MTGREQTSHRSFFYRSYDGLRLAASVYDADDRALPLVCLPGLSRTARDFHELALRISADPGRPRRVIAFDYRGRGRAEHDPNAGNYSVLNELRDVFDGLAALEVPRAVFFGTSRGGILTMLAAAMRPEMIAAAILNDIGPVIEEEGLAEIRAYLGRTPEPPDWPSAIATLKRLHAGRFTALSESDWEAWARASFAERDGRPAVDYDPALAGTLASPPEPPPDSGPPPDLWPQFRALAAVPVLVLRGANSALLSAATAEAMAAIHPDVVVETVPGHGHPVQLRGAVNERIAAFLAGLPQ